ncbi:MAG TPA: DUF998 domain-containing protein [Thermoplasmata archaeon]|nr:DUF998 domain-containing protein [Thermoplasmata archaeon]
MDAEPPAASAASRERYGPLVHRSVRHGAYLWIAGVAIFLIGNIVTQIGYGSGYSLLHNYISDLGAVHCGIQAGHYFDNGYVCSPWHLVFNVSIVLMGIFLILGVLLIRTGFPPRSTRTIGLAMLAIAGIGAIGVGLSPEDFDLTIHALSAAVAFIIGNLALIVLGFAMFRDTRWDGLRAYTILSGLVGLVAFVLFYTKNYFALGVGGMERLIVAPLLLWALVAAIHLARIPTYAAPRSLPGTST